MIPDTFTERVCAVYKGEGLNEVGSRLWIPRGSGAKIRKTDPHITIINTSARL